MNEHPIPAELEGFVWNRVPSDRAQAIVAHLGSGCRKCLVAMIPHLWGIIGKEDPPAPALTPHEDAGYDAALDRAFAATLKKAGELWQERKREALALLMDSGLEALPEVPPRLRGLPFFEALLERSWALRHENPTEMVRLAEWALFVAEKLEPGRLLGNPQIADLQCRAWIELGNAYRVADDPGEAESALGQAIAVFVRGTGEEFLAARFFDIQASLYGNKRCFGLADIAVDMAYAIYRRRGDKHLAGRAIIKKATYIGYQGDSEEAILLLTQGLKLIDESRDPNLAFLVFHNQARLLLDSGRPRDARKVLFDLRTRGLNLEGRVNQLKIRWLEGQINVGMGKLEQAEQALLEVKQGFEEANLGYKAALAGLELGAVMLRRGRISDAKREVIEAADVFLAVGVAREAAASVLLLRTAFEEERTDAALLDYVIGRLRVAETRKPTHLESPAEE